MLDIFRRKRSNVVTMKHTCFDIIQYHDDLIRIIGPLQRTFMIGFFLHKARNTEL